MCPLQKVLPRSVEAFFSAFIRLTNSWIYDIFHPQRNIQLPHPPDICGSVGVYYLTPLRLTTNILRFEVNVPIKVDEKGLRHSSVSPGAETNGFHVPVQIRISSNGNVYFTFSMTWLSLPAPCRLSINRVRPIQQRQGGLFHSVGMIWVTMALS